MGYGEAGPTLVLGATRRAGGRCPVRRSPERCFPLPDLIVQRMQSLDSRSYDGSVTRALQLAVGGLGNIADPEKIRGVYCVPRTRIIVANASGARRTSIIIAACSAAASAAAAARAICGNSRRFY